MPVLKRILVATDLSAAGQRAVMRAGQLARQWDVARSADEPLRKILAAIRSEFGVQAQCHSRVGKASNVVAQAPQGQGGPIGGVGFRIAYHVPTDVLVLSS
jgi:nucleotide-binding universal stress UspA family protein